MSNSDTILVDVVTFNYFHRAEFTKHVVTPAIGVSGVGIAMASYGAFDGIVSMGLLNFWC
jgi:hypothetical protein